MVDIDRFEYVHNDMHCWELILPDGVAEESLNNKNIVIRYLNEETAVPTEIDYNITSKKLRVKPKHPYEEGVNMLLTIQNLKNKNGNKIEYLHKIQFNYMSVNNTFKVIG